MKNFFLGMRYPWANLSFALSKPYQNALQLMRKETREQINKRMNEWNQRTKETKKGRKIMEGITFLHCQLTKQAEVHVYFLDGRRISHMQNYTKSMTTSKEI